MSKKYSVKIKNLGDTYLDAEHHHFGNHILSILPVFVLPDKDPDDDDEPDGGGTSTLPTVNPDDYLRKIISKYPRLRTMLKNAEIIDPTQKDITKMINEWDENKVYRIKIRKNSLRNIKNQLVNRAIEHDNDKKTTHKLPSNIIGVQYPINDKEYELDIASNRIFKKYEISKLD